MLMYGKCGPQGALTYVFVPLGFRPHILNIKLAFGDFFKKNEALRGEVSPSLQLLRIFHYPLCGDTPPQKGTGTPHLAASVQVPGSSLISFGNRPGCSQPVADTGRPPPGQNTLGPGTGQRRPPSGRGHSGAKILLSVHRTPAGVGRIPEPLPSASTPDCGHKPRSSVPWPLQRNPKKPNLKLYAKEKHRGNFTHKNTASI
jgi:hypothetical protein